MDVNRGTTSYSGLLAERSRKLPELENKFGPSVTPPTERGSAWPGNGSETVGIAGGMSDVIRRELDALKHKTDPERSR